MFGFKNWINRESLYTMNAAVEAANRTHLLDSSKDAATLDQIAINYGFMQVERNVYDSLWRNDANQHVRIDYRNRRFVK